MRYWDSSGIVPLLVNQARSNEMQTLLNDDADVVTWWGTSIECVSAVMRLHREGNLTSGQVRDAECRLHILRSGWDEVLPTEICRRTAERVLRIHPLRAADSLQLAAALVAADHDTARFEVVCLDHRLTEAMCKEGFRCIPISS